MVLDVTQVAVSAVTTAIVSTFSTTTTIILMRYFPKILDGFEKSVKHNNGKSAKHNSEKE